MKKLRPIMFVGTGSDVGKSIINTAFCRIFKQDGYCPAPFKAQNMSLNSYATPDGKEIGRAQAVQAEACGIECCSEMNPVLLKPNSDMSAQVVLNGKPVGNQSASEYFQETDRTALFVEAMKSYYTLALRHNPVVIEGAGSISEINLWDKDITNMKVATSVDAAVYLVADIDRGGIFGSVYGTLQLLPPEERKLVEGIIINKFRGDIRLFEPGKLMLEKLCGVPVVGVIPWFRDIVLDDEDSVVVDKKNAKLHHSKTNVAVVLLPHMSNFTDFNSLERIPSIHLYYASKTEDVLRADIIIIPGSKNTISDLMVLRQKGVARAIINARQGGTPVYGICGGFQMMGREIHDPLHVEGDIECVPGLGILPVATTLSAEKTTEQCQFRVLGGSEICYGYEIHVGQTTPDYPRPLCVTTSGKEDGFALDLSCWGTYMHGIFDNPSVINSVLKVVNHEPCTESIDYRAFKDMQYDKLAALVRDNVDVAMVYKALGV